MTSQKDTKPPKEVWVRVDDTGGVGYAFDEGEFPSAALHERGTLVHYILAPAPKPEPREAVAWVIKRGDLYSYTNDHFVPERSLAARWASKEAAQDVANDDIGGSARVVKLVRKRGTP